MDKNILLQIESEFRKEVHILDRVEIFRELALEQIETALITNEILKRIRICVTDNIDQDERIMATTDCVAHTRRNVKTNEVIELYRIPEIHLTESLLNDFPVFYILQVLMHEFGHCIHRIDYEDIFLDIFCSYVHDKKCIMIQDVYNVINCYFIDNGLSNEMFIRLCGNIDKKREEYRKRNTIVYLERVR